VRVVSFVCAALGVGPLVSACGTAPAGGVPALGATALPAARDGRKTRVAFELPNGVTAILEESHTSPVVALQAWIAGGSAAESAGQGGLAHLTERAVLAGARAEAGEARAWTSLDATVFETVVAAPLAPAAVDAFGAMLARATFDAALVERLRADAVGEARRAAASPVALASDALYAAAFAGHAYGRPVLGGEATLRALAPADVTAFHARAYAGAAVTLVAVGDFDAPALRARVEAALAALPRGVAPARARPAALVGPSAAVVALDGREARLCVGFRFAESDADALAAVDVLAVTLARRGAGRLPRELVQNRQLARAAAASVFRGRDGGLLALEVPLVAGRVDEAARVVLAEASRAAAELGDVELGDARAALEGDVARAQDTAAGYARKLGFFATVAGDPAFGERYLEALRALEPGRVREIARALIRPANVALAAAVPAGGAARAADDAAARLRAVAASETGVPPRATAAPAAVSASEGVVRAVLPSGVRVLVLPDPAATTVVAHASWSGGLRVEDARSNGMTSLLAATLPRGTRTRGAARLEADLGALGGTLSAAAGRDELDVTATFLSSRWSEGLALFADCLRHPAFPEDEVERARRAALERVRDREDDADVAAERLYAATLWPGHPYRLPLAGTAASLSGLTRRRLADHFQGHYGAANLTIAVVGAVDAGRVVERLGALFADAPAALVPPPAPPAPARAADAPTEVFALAAGDDAHVVVGYPGVGLRDPDRRAAELLVEILDGPEGRLAHELGGISLVTARAWSGLDGGALVFDLASTPAAVDASVAALRAALARVTAAAFPPAELEQAKAALVRADARALASRAAVAAALARDEALGLPAGSYRRAAAALAAVPPDALARVAQRLFDPRLEIVAVVRPPAAPTVAKAAPPRTAPRPAAAAPSSPVNSGGRRAPAP
jgi:zinc protease